MGHPPGSGRQDRSSRGRNRPPPDPQRPQTPEEGRLRGGYPTMRARRPRSRFHLLTGCRRGPVSCRPTIRAGAPGLEIRMRQDSLPRASRMTGKPLLMRAMAAGPPKRPPASALNPGLSESPENGIPISGISSSTIARRTEISLEGRSRTAFPAELATLRGTARTRSDPVGSPLFTYPLGPDAVSPGPDQPEVARPARSWMRTAARHGRARLPGVPEAANRATSPGRSARLPRGQGYMARPSSPGRLSPHG